MAASEINPEWKSLLKNSLSKGFVQSYDGQLFPELPEKTPLAPFVCAAGPFYSLFMRIDSPQFTSQNMRALIAMAKEVAHRAIYCSFSEIHPHEHAQVSINVASNFFNGIIGVEIAQF